MNVNQIGASAGYTFAWWGFGSSLERILQSIKRLIELGYKKYSLEILEPPHASIYEAGTISRLLSKGRKTGVSFSSFTPYHCVKNLASVEKVRRELGGKQLWEAQK